MKFHPVSEEEMQVSSLAKEGTYSYAVIQAIDGISKKGNEKIDMTLRIWNTDSDENIVFTNLSLIKLLKHFCDVNSMQDQYNSGEINASMCLNKSGGLVVIGIDPEKPNPEGGVYKAKNIVKDYVVASNHQMKPLPGIKNELNDDIPF